MQGLTDWRAQEELCTQCSRCQSDFTAADWHMHDACRFGNASESLLQDLALQVHSQGPGPLQSCWQHGPDHELCLTYSACCAGVGF